MISQGGGRGGGRGGRGGAARPEERKKRENILNLALYVDKSIRVKFAGGREGGSFVCSAGNEDVVVEPWTMAFLLLLMSGSRQDWLPYVPATLYCC
jgi:hypothetical protein